MEQISKKVQDIKVVNTSNKTEALPAAKKDQHLPTLLPLHQENWAFKLPPIGLANSPAYYMIHMEQSIRKFCEGIVHNIGG